MSLLWPEHWSYSEHDSFVGSSWFLFTMAANVWQDVRLKTLQNELLRLHRVITQQHAVSVSLWFPPGVLINRFRLWSQTSSQAVPDLQTYSQMSSDCFLLEMFHNKSWWNSLSSCLFWVSVSLSGVSCWWALVCLCCDGFVSSVSPDELCLCHNPVFIPTQTSWQFELPQQC